jgi:hypothetical protein
MSRPTLISDLVKLIDADLQKRYIQNIEDPRNILRLRRSLKLLNGILKEFASIKLPNGVKAMAQVQQNLLTLIVPFALTHLSDCRSIKVSAPRLLLYDGRHIFRQ